MGNPYAALPVMNPGVFIANPAAAVQAACWPVIKMPDASSLPDAYGHNALASLGLPTAFYDLRAFNKDLSQATQSMQGEQPSVISHTSNLTGSHVFPGLPDAWYLNSSLAAAGSCQSLGGNRGLTGFDSAYSLCDVKPVIEVKVHSLILENIFRD